MDNIENEDVGADQTDKSTAARMVSLSHPIPKNSSHVFAKNSLFTLNCSFFLAVNAVY